MIRIVGPHFVAGVDLDHGKVVKTAPILRYMLGWDRLKVISYCMTSGWKWQEYAGSSIKGRSSQV